MFSHPDFQVMGVSAGKFLHVTGEFLRDFPSRKTCKGIKIFHESSGHKMAVQTGMFGSLDIGPNSSKYLHF